MVVDNNWTSFTLSPWGIVYFKKFDHYLNWTQLNCYVGADIWLYYPFTSREAADAYGPADDVTKNIEVTEHVDENSDNFWVEYRNGDIKD